MPKAAVIFVVLSTIVPAIAGCADPSAEQAGGPKRAAKPVKTEAVRQESVRRTLDVVGTLAASDPEAGDSPQVGGHMAPFGRVKSPVPCT